MWKIKVIGALSYNPNLPFPPLFVLSTWWAPLGKLFSPVAGNLDRTEKKLIKENINYPERESGTGLELTQLVTWHCEVASLVLAVSYRNKIWAVLTGFSQCINTILSASFQGVKETQSWAGDSKQMDSLFVQGSQCNLCRLCVNIVLVQFNWYLQF